MKSGRAGTKKSAARRLKTDLALHFFFFFVSSVSHTKHATQFFVHLHPFSVFFSPFLSDHRRGERWEKERSDAKRRRVWLKTGCFTLKKGEGLQSTTSEAAGEKNMNKRKEPNDPVYSRFLFFFLREEALVLVSLLSLLVLILYFCTSTPPPISQLWARHTAFFSKEKRERKPTTTTGAAALFFFFFLRRFVLLAQSGLSNNNRKEKRLSLLSRASIHRRTAHQWVCALPSVSLLFSLIAKLTYVSLIFEELLSVLQ